MAKSLLHSTSLFSFNTFISRVLGFIRDIVFAYYFGATAEFDAFMVAFRIPNFMRRLFAEGSFSQAFVPVLSEYRTQKTPEQIRPFIDHMTGLLGCALLMITLLGIIAAPLVVSLFAPGFLQEPLRYHLAVHLLRWTFPYLFFISLTALCSSILNSFDSFGVPAITPIFLNLILILAALFLRPFFYVPIYALAIGVFIAGIVQLLFPIIFLQYKQLLPRPRIDLTDPGVRRVLFLMVPALLGVSVAQISLLIDTVFASFLKTGSVSWLYYSERLMEFPLGVFGVAIATVILPQLSQYRAQANIADYSRTLDWALRLLLLIGVPCTLGLFLLAGPLISTLFQSGQFNVGDVLRTEKSLMAFSIGIQAFMCIKIFAAGFYSQQNMQTPVKVAIIAVLINIACNAIFIHWWGHVGLALSTTISGFFNAGLLLFLLIQKKVYFPQSGWLYYLMQLFLANSVMMLFLFFAAAPMDIWLVQAKMWKVIHLSFLIFMAMASYVFTLWLVGIRVQHFRQ